MGFAFKMQFFLHDGLSPVALLVLVTSSVHLLLDIYFGHNLSCHLQLLGRYLQLDILQETSISKWPKWTSASAHDREKGLDLSQTKKKKIHVVTAVSH